MLLDLMISRAQRGEAAIDLSRHAALSCFWSRMRRRIGRLIRAA